MPRPSIMGVNSKDSGVYLIKNILDGKVYVGSAKRLVERISNHKILLRGNRHHSTHLQHAWNKYGENVFIFGVLEVIENYSDLTIIEQKYIDKYRSADDKFGYNICPKAENNLGSKHTKGIEEKRKRMKGEGNNFYNKKHSEKAKYFIGLNNHQRKLNDEDINKIKEMWWSGDYSQQIIANIFKITQPHVSKIVNNRKRIKLNTYVSTP